MNLLPRFVTSILCCTIAFGHVPAWIHVSDCDSSCHLTVSAFECMGNSCCSHHCHHQDDQSSDLAHDGLRVDASESSSRQHDCEGCAICQSLNNHYGMTWQFVYLSGVGAVYQPARLPAERLLVSASFSIVHPRGPPSLA